MADKTGIEWTDATWNPVTGCSKVSPGCAHCYAETIAHRFAGTPAYPNGFAVTLRPERLDQPLRWKRPRRVFVNSMSDLFHDDIPTDYIWRVFTVMLQAEQHTFQVLTKRPERMRSVLEEMHMVSGIGPAPNVWLGVSVENNRHAYRADVLRATPAAVRFISAEPLLGPLDDLDPAGLDWIIVGGESGHGARPMHPSWPRSLRDRCAAAGVAYFFKQWGAHVPLDQHPETGSLSGRRTRPDDTWPWMIRGSAKAHGRMLDGATHDEMPEAIHAV